MKQLLPITASIAILAVSVPFVANQWIEFSGRNATWKEAVALKNLQNEQAIAYIQAQQATTQAEQEAAQRTAFAQACKESWNQAADEFNANPQLYMQQHNIAFGSTAWRQIYDYAMKRRDTPLPLYDGIRATGIH
jgi:hypothetical protein